MITSSAFSGKRFAILGLARSGLAAAEALLDSGALVTAWDRQDVARDKLAGRATLADPLEIDLAGFDAIVVSPGVPLNTHPITERAKQAGVPIIGDIELFAMARESLPKHRVVGITGTNGKSTTTALVDHLLRHAGMQTRMAGNIGLPILGEEPLPAGGVYVLELSSYQIDITHSLDCDVAALTNITPDHLDRYAGFEAYASSKARLFAMQSADSFAVCGAADEPSQAILQREQARRPATSAVAANRARIAPLQHQWPSLQGPHNLENTAIAVALVEELGLSEEQWMAGLASFRGLAHRMEWLGSFDGVAVYNDSKATNTASTAPALAAFPPQPHPRIHWIVGGLPKEDGLADCADHLGNVAAAYTIGEAGPMFARELEGRVRVETCELLSEATKRAMKAAKPGDIVLLSPACASFDQFTDFEARGNDFKRIGAALVGGDHVPHLDDGMGSEAA